MTAERSLNDSPDVARRGASRPTIVVGFACIGGLVGLVVGAFVGVAALGMDLPDDANYLPSFMLICAGLGWLVGALLGSKAGSDARPPGTVGRGLLLLGAVAVVIGATTLAIWPTPTGWPEVRVRLFPIWSLAGGAMAEALMLLDALFVLATLLVVSKPHVRVASDHPGRVVGVTGIAGLLVGALVFSFATGQVALGWSGTITRHEYRAVSRTAASLLTAAGRHERRTGSFPTTLEDLLARGGKVRPGTQVEFVGVVNGAFCVRVGVDLGEERSGDPHSSGLARPRPPGADSWTSISQWKGNSCTQD